jgi:hypothetical protein
MPEVRGRQALPCGPQQGGLALDAAEAKGQMILKNLRIIIQQEVGSAGYRCCYGCLTRLSLFHISSYSTLCMTPNLAP